MRDGGGDTPIHDKGELVRQLREAISGVDSLFKSLLPDARSFEFGPICNVFELFRRKVLDIYATGVDYDPRAEASQQFSWVVQNKCAGRRTATPLPR